MSYNVIAILLIFRTTPKSEQSVKEKTPSWVFQRPTNLPKVHSHLDKGNFCTAVFSAFYICCPEVHQWRECVKNICICEIPRRTTCKDKPLYSCKQSTRLCAKGVTKGRLEGLGALPLSSVNENCQCREPQVPALSQPGKKSPLLPLKWFQCCWNAPRLLKTSALLLYIFFPCNSSSSSSVYIPCTAAGL